MTFVPNPSVDLVTLSNRTNNISPASGEFDFDAPVDTTDLAANTYYYPSTAGFEMSTVANISAELSVSGGVTVTFEAKLNAGSVFQDITQMGNALTTTPPSQGFTSFVDTDAIVDFDDLHVRNFRIKVVTSDGTNAVKLDTKRTEI